jgi:hypothetical protein
MFDTYVCRSDHGYRFSSVYLIIPDEPERPVDRPDPKASGRPIASSYRTVRTGVGLRRRGHYDELVPTDTTGGAAERAECNPGRVSTEACGCPHTHPPIEAFVRTGPIRDERHPRPRMGHASTATGHTGSPPDTRVRPPPSNRSYGRFSTFRTARSWASSARRSISVGERRIVEPMQVAPCGTEGHGARPDTVYCNCLPVVRRNGSANHRY